MSDRVNSLVEALDARCARRPESKQLLERHFPAKLATGRPHSRPAPRTLSSTGYSQVTLHHPDQQDQDFAKLDDLLDMEQWRHLRQSDGHLPPLLTKASFSKNGYNVHLTDLSRVWAERLEKADIIARARLCNCSIDPSEDVEQYGIFLGKVQSALQQHDKTILTLSTSKDNHLKLHLVAPLPSPLPAFEWEINLKQASDRSVEVDLVSPLLQQAHDLNQRMQALIAELQAKDKVIAKITDRLETSGHGLADVFPGAANMKLTGKKSQQEHFARHVRGLGKFDEKAWAAETTAGSNAVPVSSNSANAVFASLPPSNVDAAEQETGMGWWQRLPHGRHIALGEVKPSDTQPAQSNKRNQEQSRAKRRNSVEGHAHDDDDFQRQATPPHLRNHSHLPTTHVDTEMGEADDDPALEEESTEDEDDLDGPPLKSKPSRHYADDDETHAALEVKSKTPSPPPIVNPTGPTSNTRGPFTHEEDTEDDDDDLDGPSQTSQKAPSASQLPSRQKSLTPQPSLSTAPSPRKRLGTFGGRARTKSPAAMSSTPTEEHEDPVPASPPPQKPKAKGKLGMMGGSKTRPQPPSSSAVSTDAEAPPPVKRLGTIGGKREAMSSRAATASVTPEPQHKEAANLREPDTKAEPAEPEDPVERANAKRDALKRELEAKAKAPAKKKRKF
jgi:hypothetical protein